MSCGPSISRRLASALKAAKKAELIVHRFEIDPTGKVVVLTGKEDHTADSNNTQNPWDEVLIHAPDEKRPS
jgi:hypothetical protein